MTGPTKCLNFTDLSSVVSVLPTFAVLCIVIKKPDKDTVFKIVSWRPAHHWYEANPDSHNVTSSPNKPNLKIAKQECPPIDGDLAIATTLKL